MRTGLIHVVGVAALLALGSSKAYAIPPTERQALLDFQAALGGPADWGGDEGTECTWTGIICSAGGEHVLELS